MSDHGPILLRDLTTLRVGGPAARFVEARTEAELIRAVADADERGEPVLVLGGGSNVVVADGGFAGTVVKIATRGVDVDADECDDLACLGAVTVRAQAGEPWDAFVERAVESSWTGVEALAGIPGAVGATPIQNVGAYGQEVGHTIASVRTWDRRTRSQRTFAATDCGFGYRTSRFKQEPGRYLVLEVTFLFKQGTLGAPIAYAELARRLEVGVGDRARLPDVRRAVLELRRGKGMVLDDADHDTWSAGSFFTNPVVSREQAERLPAGAPRWEQVDGQVKTSAAWLIEHAGFGKGFGAGRATLSTKHTLAVTNRGGASAADLIALASEIHAGVLSAFGVTLAPEPVLIGLQLEVPAEVGGPQA